MKSFLVLVLFGSLMPLLGSATPQRSVRKISKVMLAFRNGSPPLVADGTLQVFATATYSDGTTATLPDSQGNTATAWNTSNHAIAKIDASGDVMAIAPGTISITAMVGSLAAQPMAVTVGSRLSTSPVENDEPEAAPVAEAREVPSASDIPDAATPGPSPSPTPPEPSPAQSPAPQDLLEPAIPSAPSLLAGPVPAAHAGPLSDNFIGPFWTADGPPDGAASISDSHLFLGVPGGANHDPFATTNQAMRVVQPIGDVNFDVAMKIDSPLVAADGNTSQGLMVLAANGDFLTFALTTDGNQVGLMGRTVTAGAPTTVLDDTALSEYQNPSYLRLKKSGSAYVALYSVDGATWKQAASFTDAMSTASLGPFVSNFSNSPANALPVIMAVNWFEVQ